MYKTVDKIFPKVLIVGETFQNKTGSGITISNFFKNWPKNNLAIAARSIIWHSDTNFCDNFYKLGYQLPSFLNYFRFLKKHISPYDGPIFSKDIEYQKKKEEGVNSTSKKQRKFTFLLTTLNFILQFTGLYPFFYKVAISESFHEWIIKFKPDIIYFPPTSYEQIRFVIKLNQKFKIPIAIHPMDDHIRMIYPKGPFYFLWKYKINKDFKYLINISKLHLSICDYMSLIYEKRYKQKFFPFHNPIDIKLWQPYSKTQWHIDRVFKVLYAGRFGFDNEKALHLLCSNIELLNKKGFNIELDLRFSLLSNNSFIKKFNIYEHTHIRDFTPHDEMPLLLSKYDLLFLPLGFSKRSVRFAKLSMPTKTSEYMISGVPIMVYAPKTTALCQYALKYKWAYVIYEENNSIFINALIELYTKINLRETLGNAAMRLAIEKHSAEFVRREFKNLLLASIIKN